MIYWDLLVEGSLIFTERIAKRDPAELAETWTLAAELPAAFVFVT